MVSCTPLRVIPDGFTWGDTYDELLITRNQLKNCKEKDDKLITQIYDRESGKTTKTP